MTPKEQTAMQQALEALEELFHSNSTKVAVEKYNIAHNALREALTEQAEQEPVAWAHPSGGHLSARYMKEFATGLEKETHTIPLYAAPVRTVDLTDDEIYTLYSEPCSDREMVEFARAVIAADRSKNGII